MAQRSRLVLRRFSRGCMLVLGAVGLAVCIAGYIVGNIIQLVVVLSTVTRGRKNEDSAVRGINPHRRRTEEHHAVSRAHA